MADGSSDPHNSRTYTLPLRNFPVNVSINAQGALPDELEQVLRQMMVEQRTNGSAGGGSAGGPSEGNDNGGVIVAGPSNNNVTTQLHRVPMSHRHHQHSHGQPADSAVIDMGDGAHLPDGVDHEEEHQHQHLDASQRDWRVIWKLVENSVIFAVILLAKLLYDHRLGILVFVGLFATFYHANSTLTTQIALRESRRYGRSALLLLWVIVFLVTNIWCIYYMFEDQQLYRSLLFMLPNFSSLDVWHLFWVVVIADYVVRYATIILKTIVALLPKTLLKFRKKKKVPTATLR